MLLFSPFAHDVSYLIAPVFFNSAHDGRRLEFFRDFMFGFKDKECFTSFTHFHHIRHDFFINLDFHLKVNERIRLQSNQPPQKLGYSSHLRPTNQPLVPKFMQQYLSACCAFLTPQTFLFSLANPHNYSCVWKRILYLFFLWHKHWQFAKSDMKRWTCEFSILLLDNNDIDGSRESGRIQLVVKALHWRE